MVGVVVLPAVGGHPLSPGGVMPELGVLVAAGDDPGRPELLVPDLTVTEAHGEVQWVALAHLANGAARALVPVLAVLLFEHARRAKDFDGTAELLVPLF